jgi:hypothetical protein
LFVHHHQHKKGKGGREKKMRGVPKVYGVAASPFVATVLVCLEEVGPLDMAAREQRAPHHLARNVRSTDFIPHYTC